MQYILAAALIAQFTGIDLSKSNVAPLVQSISDYLADPTELTSEVPIDRNNSEVLATSPSAAAALGKENDEPDAPVSVAATTPTIVPSEPAPIDSPAAGVAVLSGPILPSVLIPPSDASSTTPTWYRLYRGYYYCVPAPDTRAPFYCVTKGLRVGLFAGW